MQEAVVGYGVTADLDLLNIVLYRVAWLNSDVSSYVLLAFTLMVAS